MRRYLCLLAWSILLASFGGAQAKLDLNSTSNIVVYWGQNSFNGKGDQAQQPLAHYCDNEDIDVIPMAFNMMVNGPGGAPEIDFSVTSKDCDVFEGTELKNCPSIAKDIQTCQKKNKTILLSIGGATYSEGGFKSDEDAKDGAKLMWETFGPKKENSTALRPFGDAALDGFDLDFEANVQHMAPFANELRSLMKADKSKQDFYLTSAPQCPYPDEADKEILNGPVYIDAIWVQFYNNYCGVNNFNTDSSSNKYNFEEWDTWAKTVSQNKDVKVIVGVPAFTSAASTGYIPASELAKVIEYTKKFDSFGGVMMWDATQAYENDGFIEDVRESLGSANDSGSSSPDPVSTSASASTSTDPTKTTTTTTTTTTTRTTTTTTTTTSPSSNAPVSSHSSSSSSSASASHKGAEETTTTTTTTTKEHKPTVTTTTQKPVASTTQPKPTTIVTTTAKPKASSTTSAETTATPTSNGGPNSPSDDDNSDDGPNDESGSNLLGSILGNDLLGLLGGLRKANKAASGITHGLANNL
ncbi:CAZyme family GH18 [Penicillium roqueforti]|uniref:CAZyme family GH18 n=1 Tax=Penicillium roqueforti TaxID=5082 RepID=UPI00190A57A8|nr:CAZyme family GH18 [Penicillium roqueforti]KAF9246691.1 CAZyme family GH18 [Penicillium roqueforti]KAI1832490.1 CAZyme family GH18 [Penicillium roqueforti]KAI2676172.1 CAZyme family GH18 [Penicillium roqueforti]KAI2683348.1 CAZyme family GH18 [Penicillium roqueforti]KAI2714521.1 CAZyme family GH18 [Penicillium roqueforti]